MLRSTLLLSLLGCTIASNSYFGYQIAPQNHPNPQYPPSGTPDDTQDGSGNNAYPISGQQGSGGQGGLMNVTIIRSPGNSQSSKVIIDRNGKRIVINCNLCRLCCLGKNSKIILLPRDKLDNGNGNGPFYPAATGGYITGPGNGVNPSGGSGLPSNPGPLPAQNGNNQLNPFPEGTNNQPPNAANHNSNTGPNGQPGYQPQQQQGYPYNTYRIAPEGYATPPTTTPSTTTPSTTTPSTTTSTTTQRPCIYVPPTTTQAPTRPPCQYTPEPVSFTVPEPTEQNTLAPPPNPSRPGVVSECCSIDLRSIQAVVSCGVAVRRAGCCSQSCSASSGIQRRVTLNWQLLAQYAGIRGPQISCNDAVSLGLVQESEIKGICGFIVAPFQRPSWPSPSAPELPSPTDKTGGEVIIPPATEGGEKPHHGSYVLPSGPNGSGPVATAPPTSSTGSFAMSIFTIIVATVLCF